MIDNIKHMHVKIVGFKCHLDASYDFDSNSMVLLRGESGAGKSTILQAIFWALYGSMRGIYNNTGQMKKCSVTLQINHLVIYRQKRPELFRVTIIDPRDQTEKTYVDTVAQQIIDQAFGTKDLWKSCSYVSQKERCSLLSGSAAERLTLLNQLSFDQDNPKDYITRIDQELKDVNKKFIEVQATFTAELNLYTNQLNTRPITVTLTDPEIEQLKVEINNLEEESKRLYDEVLAHERNSGSYNMVCSQIQQAETRLASLPTTEYDETEYNQKVASLREQIERIKEQVTLVRHYNNTKSRAEKLQTDINTNQQKLKVLNDQINTHEVNNNQVLSRLQGLGYDPTNPPPVTEQTVWQVSQQEQQRSQHEQECQSLGCQYDQNSINVMIKQYQEEVSTINNMNHNIQQYNHLNNNLKSLQTQLDNIVIDETLLLPDQIAVLEQQNQATALEISELKKGLELLQCPECSKPLRYVNNQLVPGERDPVNPIQIQEKEVEYRSRISQISNIRSTIQRSHQKQAIVDQIKMIEGQMAGIDVNQLEEYMKAPKNTNQIQNLLSRLTRIQIVSLPSYTSTFLRLVYQYNQMRTTGANLISQKDQLVMVINQGISQLGTIQIPDNPSHDLITLGHEITTHENVIKQLDTDHQKNIHQRAARLQLLSTIETLNYQKNSIQLNPTAKTVYETTISILNQNKTKQTEALYSKEMVIKQNSLNTVRNEVMDTQEDLVALQRLKQNAINVECKQLQDTVDTINQSLEDILPMFFVEPITMVLQLYKVLKTKKQVKPGLNIVIKYKGVDYDNINQLSGGEGDRISLALVLALNQVSNSPVVLLDECISSLDGNVKESCITAMKNLEGKTIVCVDHEGVEGYYDKTILVNH